MERLHLPQYSLHTLLLLLRASPCFAAASPCTALKRLSRTCTAMIKRLCNCKASPAIMLTQGQQAYQVRQNTPLLHHPLLADRADKSNRLRRVYLPILITGWYTPHAILHFKRRSPGVVRACFGHCTYTPHQMWPASARKSAHLYFSKGPYKTQPAGLAHAQHAVQPGCPTRLQQGVHRGREALKPGNG